MDRWRKLKYVTKLGEGILALRKLRKIISPEKHLMDHKTGCKFKSVTCEGIFLEIWDPLGVHEGPGVSRGVP